MNLTLIVVLLQMALALLNTNPQDAQTAVVVNQAVKLATEALKPQPVWVVTNKGLMPGVLPSSEARESRVSEFLKEQYPFTPVSPCGTLPCTE